MQSVCSKMVDDHIKSENVKLSSPVARIEQVSLSHIYKVVPQITDRLVKGRDGEMHTLSTLLELPS